MDYQKGLENVFLIERNIEGKQKEIKVG